MRAPLALVLVVVGACAPSSGGIGDSMGSAPSQVPDISATEDDLAITTLLVPATGTVATTLGAQLHVTVESSACLWESNPATVVQVDLHDTNPLSEPHGTDRRLELPGEPDQSINTVLEVRENWRVGEYRLGLSCFDDGDQEVFHEAVVTVSPLSSTDRFADVGTDMEALVKAYDIGLLQLCDEGPPPMLCPDRTVDQLGYHILVRTLFYGRYPTDPFDRWASIVDGSMAAVFQSFSLAGCDGRTLVDDTTYESVVACGETTRATAQQLARSFAALWRRDPSASASEALDWFNDQGFLDRRLAPSDPFTRRDLAAAAIGAMEQLGDPWEQR